MHRIRNFLLINQVAPKWAVFIFDNVVSVFAILFAYCLRYNFHYADLIGINVYTPIVLVFLTNTLFFYFFRTYQGIIRFSGATEAIRTSSALFGSFLLLMVLTICSKLFSIEKSFLIPPSVLIINLFTSTFLMVSYRLLVKFLYKSTFVKQECHNVVIFGGELNGSKLKQTIEQSSDMQYRVVAFIDDDPSYIGKSIDSVKIYSFEQAKTLLANWDVKMLLFSKQDISVEDKNKVVDYCLSNNIQLRNIPPVNQWIKGHLSISQLKNVKIEELLGRPPISIKNQKVVDLMSTKRILITGAAGSIGSELARQIAVINPSLLIICDQNETGLYELEYELKNHYPNCENISVYIGDVKDETSMQALFDKFHPQVVYHAAAYKHVPMMEYHPSEAIRNNVLGTRILADLSVKFDVERFLLVSTDKAINPTNVMGASKRIAEIYVQSLGKKSLDGLQIVTSEIDAKPVKTKFITTRFGNVLGSNGSVIPRFKEQIEAGGPVTVTHPDIIRFFMTIPEACSLVLEAATTGNGGEVFIFDMGAPVKIADLAKKMIKLAGFIPNQDIEIKFTGLRPGEKLYEELLNKEEEVLPTHNKKIMITKVVEYDYFNVSKSLDNLVDYAFQNRDLDVVRQMKRIVPEFISKNSIYQAIDEINQAHVASTN